MNKPALDGFHPLSYVFTGAGFPNGVIVDPKLVKFRFQGAGVGGLLFVRVGRGLPHPLGKVHWLGEQYVVWYENRSLAQVVAQLLGFLDLGREKLRVDGAAVDLLQRHPALRENR